MIRLLKWIGVAAMVTGCMKSCDGGMKRGDMTPEQVVEAYLDTAFSMTDVAEKELLIAYTTGALREAIENANDDTLKRAYIDQKVTLESYELVGREDRTPRETEISYRLKYRDFEKGEVAEDDAATVDTTNTVLVFRENGVWKISDILGAETTIDFPLGKENQITISK